jgi:hypothetical protein
MPEKLRNGFFREAIIENADEPQLNAGVLTHTRVWLNARFFDFLETTLS